MASLLLTPARLSHDLALETNRARYTNYFCAGNTVAIGDRLVKDHCGNDSAQSPRKSHAAAP